MALVFKQELKMHKCLGIDVKFARKENLPNPVRVPFHLYGGEHASIRRKD